MEFRVPLERDSVRLDGARPLALVLARLDVEAGRPAPLRRADASLAALTRIRLESLITPGAYDVGVAEVLGCNERADVTGTGADRARGGTLTKRANRPHSAAPALTRPYGRLHAGAAPPTRTARNGSGSVEQHTEPQRTGRAARRHPASTKASPPGLRRVATEQAGAAHGLDWVSVRVLGGVRAANTPLAVTEPNHGHRSAPGDRPSSPDDVRVRQILSAVGVDGGRAPDATPADTAASSAPQNPNRPEPARAGAPRPAADPDHRAAEHVRAPVSESPSGTPPVTPRLPARRRADPHQEAGQLAALVRSWGANPTAAETDVPRTRASTVRAAPSPPDPARPPAVGEPPRKRSEAAAALQADELLAAAVGRVLTSELERYGIEINEP
jgi:hypothetical protein